MLEFKLNQKVNVYKFPNSPSKYISTILGTSNNTIILTRPHIVRNRRTIYMENVNPNSLVYIDYEYEGKIYYFRSKIIKSNFTPFPHVIITFPDEKNIKVIHLRKENRYKTYLPISILFKKEGQVIKFLEAYTIDLSKNGIGLVCPIELPEKFSIDIILFGENIQILCEKKAFIMNKFSNFHYFGAEIININNSEIFNKYLSQLKIINEYLK